MDVIPKRTAKFAEGSQRSVSSEVYQRTRSADLSSRSATFLSSTTSQPQTFRNTCALLAVLESYWTELRKTEETRRNTLITLARRHPRVSHHLHIGREKASCVAYVPYPQI